MSESRTVIVCLFFGVISPVACELADSEPTPAVVIGEACRRLRAVIAPLVWWRASGSDGEVPAGHGLAVRVPRLSIDSDVHHDPVILGQPIANEL